MSAELRTRFPRVLRNFGSLSLGRTLGDLLTFALFVVLSRVYGEEGTGQYSIAMAATGFFAVSVDFGLYSYAVREMSVASRRTEEGRRVVLSQVLGVRLFLGAIALALLILFLPRLSDSGALSSILLWIGLYQILYLIFDILMTPYVAEERMMIASGFELALRAAIAVGGVGLALSGASLGTMVTVFPIATVLVGAIALGTVLRHVGKVKVSDLFGSVFRTMMSSKDFALYVFLRQLASRADIILIGLFLGAVAAGVYNAAYRIIFMLMFLPYFAGVALLPQATRLYEVEAGGSPDREEMEGSPDHETEAGSPDPSSIGSVDSGLEESGVSFAGLLSRSLNAILILAVPIAAGLWTVAPEAVSLLYGSGQFQDSVWILRWLSALVFVAFIKLMLGTFLTASQRQPDRVRGQWIAAMINVLGNVVLIPTVGLRGAIFATLLAEAGATVFYWFRLRRFIPSLRLPTFILPALLGSAAFVVLFEWFWRPHWIAIVAVGAVLYIGVVSLSPAVRREGTPFLLSLFVRRRS